MMSSGSLLREPSPTKRIRRPTWAKLEYAVLLFGGWLLMVPRDKSPGTVDVQAPIATWRQESAYDTAKDCEAARTKAGFERNDAVTWGFGRCVPTEAVYPPPAPAKGN